MSSRWFNWMWLKIKDCPPPWHQDILLLLSDKTMAVGRINNDGVIQPQGGRCRDEECILVFDSEPIAWHDLPPITNKEEAR